jgi:hypothetical protein
MDLSDVVFFASIAIAAVVASLVLAGFVETGDTMPRGAFATTVCAVTASLLTLSHAFFHLRNYAHPRRQRLVLRVLMLVVVYSADSLWAFFDRYDASLVAVARDTYEALALQAFFSLLLDIAESENIYEWWRVENPTMEHLFPLRGSFALNRGVVKTWRACVTQYTVLSPLLTLVVFLLHHFELYDESSWSALNGHLWIALAKCVSVSVAFTAVLYLYLATKHNERVHHYQPTLKFLSLKAVIFLCCWQGLVLWGLEALGLINVHAAAELFLTDSTRRTMSDAELGDAVVGALESALVCFEMLLAAIAHQYVFSWRESQLQQHALHAPHAHKGASAGKASAAKGAATAAETTTTAPDRKLVLVHTSVINSALHFVSVSDLVDEARAGISSALEGMRQRSKSPQPGQRGRASAATVAAAKQAAARSKET